MNQALATSITSHPGVSPLMLTEAQDAWLPGSEPESQPLSPRCQPMAGGAVTVSFQINSFTGSLFLNTNPALLHCLEAPYLHQILDTES